MDLDDGKKDSFYYFRRRHQIGQFGNLLLQLSRAVSLTSNGENRFRRRGKFLNKIQLSGTSSSNNSAIIGYARSVNRKIRGIFKPFTNNSNKKPSFLYLTHYFLTNKYKALIIILYMKNHRKNYLILNGIRMKFSGQFKK